MQHIDEHSLELYVLGSASVAKRRQEIEAHIAECHGCRELVAQISTFYKEAGMGFEKHPKDAPVAENALVRSRNELKPVFEPLNSPPIAYRPITAMQKFYYFTRKHPVVVGGGALLSIAALALTINFSRPQPIKKVQNPSRIALDEKHGTVRIVDDNFSTMWEWTTEEANATETYSRIVIRDLNGDGTNEVITTLRLGDPRPADVIALKIFDARQTLLRRRQFNRPVDYRGRSYSSVFSAGRLLAGDFAGIGRTEIIVHARNMPRSPSILVRLDSTGNEIGAFWHFGDINILASIDLGNDRKKEIFAGGVNDLADTIRGEFPVLVVVDPEKINGNERASASTVFNLPPSDAELYYLRFPVSSLDSLLLSGPSVTAIQDGNDEKLYVSVGEAKLGENILVFDYVFDTHMRALEVKSSNGGAMIQEELLRLGKPAKALDRAYLENLRKGVRYWDGTQWVKQPTRVKTRDRIVDAR